MTAALAPAFEGLRVLDFSRVIAGPNCTQTLADFGCDVIKIEHPTAGDDGRHIAGAAHGGESHFFLAFNRGKRSVGLDMSKAEAQAIAHKLAAQSDIVIENFRPGVAARLGIDYATLSAINPRLIYLSISAYGQEGPFADRPGFDPVLQAESGMMAMTGPVDGPGYRHPISIIDTLTSLHATTALSAALYAREKTGKGQNLELALFDAAVAATANAALHYLVSGEEIPRGGNAHPSAAPVNVFPASDGPIYMALGNQRLWETFCRLIERPDLNEDERFCSMAARSKNRDALYSTLDAIFTQHPRAYWSERLRALPAGPVQSISESLESEATTSRGLVEQVEHPKGLLRQISSIYRFSETPVRHGLRAPLLGEHTEEVLRELCGFEPSDLEALRDAGAIV